MILPPDLIVSVSGVRGIVGQSLTPIVAIRFALAYGTPLAGRTVLLSRDGRPSGNLLGNAVASGLMAAGCHVEDLGIAPTPTVGVAVTWRKAAGAIQISASHNPAPWNGLKLFGPDGSVLTAAEGAVIKTHFESGTYSLATWDKVGRSTPAGDAFGEHLRRVLAVVEVESIRKAGFTAVVDANGGSGGPPALRLLDALGVKPVSLGCEPTGLFAHEAEPIPAHLTTVAPEIPRANAAVGFVLDPDADRLALIDERGVCVSEELTLALAVRAVLAKRKGPVVVNMSTSRVNEDLATAAGCAFRRSAVGEANVVALMRISNAAIGGEGNGGVIDPRVGWVRDPFVGMALILEYLAAERKPLSALLAALPSYSMLKTKMAVAKETLPAALAKLKAAFPGANLNETDGLRIDGPDWWLHVRPSNTEPVVRAIAEAPTEARAKELCERAADVLNST